jgi:hypothetical protein
MSMKYLYRIEATIGVPGEEGRRETNHPGTTTPRRGHHEEI